MARSYNRCAIRHPFPSCGRILAKVRVSITWEGTNRWPGIIKWVAQIVTMEECNRMFIDQYYYSWYAAYQHQMSIVATTISNSSCSLPLQIYSSSSPSTLLQIRDSGFLATSITSEQCLYCLGTVISGFYIQHLEVPLNSIRIWMWILRNLMLKAYQIP